MGVVNAFQLAKLRGALATYNAQRGAAYEAPN